LIRAHTLCIRIYLNHYSNHNLSSKIYFRMIPIALALFYCKISISITSKFSWINLQLFKFKYEDLSNYLHKLILILFGLFHLYNSKSYDHTYSPTSSWHHIDTYHIYLNLVCLIHTYSNFNWAIWVKVWYISILVTTFANVVLLLHYLTLM
jgi:hypothetical protein